jgi:hypothetical protein
MPDDEHARPEEAATGRLDIPTLRTLARRAESHPLVDGWTFDPSSVSPRLLRLRLALNAYPSDVTAARIDIRWFSTGDYSFHYLETRAADSYQCRWDRHPKPTAPRAHFHPPPDAGDAEPSSLAPHHLDALFTVLDWVSDRVEGLYGSE